MGITLDQLRGSGVESIRDAATGEVLFGNGPRRTLDAAAPKPKRPPTPFRTNAKRRLTTGDIKQDNIIDDALNIQYNHNTMEPTKYLNEISPDKLVARCTLGGNPQGKQRARYSSATGGFYTPKETKLHEQALALAVKAQIGNATPDKEWIYGIRSIFYVQTHHRKDVDNMMKAVLDSLNRVVFVDDAQVKEIMGWKVLDCSRPRTEFVVYRICKDERDGGTCQQCGKEFRKYKSWRARLYCSRRCNTIAVTKSETVACSFCKKELLRTPTKIAASKTGEYFCSGSCKGKYSRHDISCAACNKPLSRALSSTKKGQKNFYCSISCRNTAFTGAKSPIPPERRAEINARAWATRKAKAANSARV